MNSTSKGGIVREASVLMRSIPSVTVALFVAATISMNLLANKSINLPVSFLALDVGFIVSWMVFLTLDVVTKHYGPRAATILTVVGLLVNFGMCLIFFAGSRIPGVWGESYVTGSEGVINTALDHTFGGTWYVLVGSSIAFFVSAVVNNFSNYYIGRGLQKRGKEEDSFRTYAVRTYLSTAIGQFVDNLTFALIVSHHFFGWTMTQCITCAITGAVMELLCEVIFSPLGYRVSRKWKEEGVGKEYISIYGTGQESRKKRAAAVGA